jgi:hypothetical protein
MMLTANESSGESIANFVQKHGDPIGVLSADHPSTTAGWANLVALLAPIASAWGPENAEGVSSVERDTDAAAWIRFTVLGRLPGLMTLIPDPSGAPDLVPRTDSLAGFMLTSAASGFRRQVQMRRCRVCSTWFELPRKDALYCSSACRTIHHREQTTAAEREQAAALERLASPVEYRRKQAELNAQLRKQFDPAERQKQAENAAHMRDLAERLSKKKKED